MELSERAGEARRWPWFAIGATVLAVVVFGWVVRGPGQASRDVAASRQHRPAAWVAYRPGDGSFTVVGPPSPSNQTTETALGTERAFRFPAPAGETLAAATLDLAPRAAGGASEQQLVSAWANRLLGQLNGVIDEQDILRAGAHPGVALRVDEGGRSVLVRVFAAGTRLFEVAAVVPDTAPPGERAAATSFVSSFAPTP